MGRHNGLMPDQFIRGKICWVDQSGILREPLPGPFPPFLFAEPFISHISQHQAILVAEAHAQQPQACETAAVIPLQLGELWSIRQHLSAGET